MVWFGRVLWPLSLLLLFCVFVLFFEPVLFHRFDIAICLCPCSMSSVLVFFVFVPCPCFCV